MKDTNNLIQLGKEQLDNGNYDEALDFFGQALLLDPANPDLWNLKGITLRLSLIHI